MKIAFVIPWFGDIPGGAESECKNTAKNMAVRGIDVEILTTCARELASDWGKDYYKEGVYEEEGLKVRRFSVKKRNADLFNRINLKLMRRMRISPEEEIQFITESISSDNLYEYIDRHRNEYKFLFIPYMFGTTYWGSRVARGNSYIIPCLHNESYAYLGIYKDMFLRTKGVIFHTKAERELGKKLYSLDDEKAILLGEGVNTDVEFNSSRFREKFKITDEFILYAGRKDEGKNVPLLIDYFCKFKYSHPESNIKLILMGNGEVRIPTAYQEHIIDMGYVAKQDKYDAYSAAFILCQPSVNESFSLVIMEAWLCETPVLVHGCCDVTRQHCIDSNGGLYFKNLFEFFECLLYFTESREIARKMALNGKKYVLGNYNWDLIIDRYKKLLLDK